MKELINLEEINPAVLFQSDNEVSEVIENLQKSARSIVCTVETAKGRKETASLAAKVAKSKTYLDSLGKELVSGIKQQAKEIDGRRKIIRDTLDDLKEEVRAPLTAYETKQRERIAEHDKAIAELDFILASVPAADGLVELGSLMDLYLELSAREWEEYQEIADNAGKKIKEAVSKKKAQIDESIRQAEEITRLKEEAKEREQKEREERIAREAAEAARVAEENRIKAEREAEQRRLREAEEAKLEAERLVLEAERREIEQAKQAELEKEQARIDAIEQDRIHKEQIERAAAEEREKIAEAKRREEAETAAREADKKHRATINNEALDCLVSGGVSVTAAKKAITLIAQGKISHVKINY